MKYLDSPDHRPTKRLDSIMWLRFVDGDMPYKKLHTLYNHIFSCIKDISTMLKILGFFCSSAPTGLLNLSLQTICYLSHLDEEDVYLRLLGLHSIFYIPPPKTSELGDPNDPALLPCKISLSTNYDPENIRRGSIPRRSSTVVSTSD